MVMAKKNTTMGSGLLHLLGVSKIGIFSYYAGINQETAGSRLVRNVIEERFAHLLSFFRGNLMSKCDRIQFIRY